MASYIKYNNVSMNSVLSCNLAIVTIDEEQARSVSNYSVENVRTAMNYHNTVARKIGSKCSQPISFKITLAKEDGSSFSLEEIRKISRWLTGDASDHKLEYVDNTENPDSYYYFGSFTSIENVRICNQVGVCCNFENDSQFAYKDYSTTASTSSTVSKTVNCDNDTDFCYPEFEITTTANASVTISNTTTSQSFTIQTKADNTVKIDCETQKLSDEDGTTTLASYVNGIVFPYFTNGNNVLSITTTAGILSLTINYKINAKVGVMNEFNI